MKIVLLPALTACILLANLSQAQSIYQINFAAPAPAGGTSYDVLLAVNEATSGFLRVNYSLPKDGKKTQAEMQATVEYVNDESGQIDSTQFYYHCSNPRLIMGDQQTTIPAFQIWFRFNPQSKMVEPSFVKWPGDAGQQATTGTFNSATLLSTAQLNRQLLLQYFAESDAFASNLLNPSVRALSPLEKTTKIHLIIVANTNDPSIGIPCNNSMLLMEETFTDLAAFMGLKIALTKIYGNNYNKAAVEYELTKLKPGYNDVVLFYYVGHGFRKPTDNRNFPFIDLRANAREDFMKQSLQLEDVFSQIKLKNARLNIVMGDCCNAEPTATNPMVPADPRPRASNIEFDLEKCRQLFLNTRRMSLLLTAAEKGQLASCNAALGAFFTYYFKSSMETALKDVKTSNISWYQVIDKARAQTVNKARRTYCDKPYVPANICKQTPFYLVL
ncbi:MAG: hypothetical protein EOO03_01505 [Chitinophagaceae bacterium]|nr:MAG: hypothetical protein EOO03_01505 [Chitinophagaceae bacterium]